MCFINIEPNELVSTNRLKGSVKLVEKQGTHFRNLTTWGYKNQSFDDKPHQTGAKRYCILLASKFAQSIITERNIRIKFKENRSIFIFISHIHDIIIRVYNS